jgi:hypothetical protein
MNFVSLEHLLGESRILGAFWQGGGFTYVFPERKILVTL